MLVSGSRKSLTQHIEISYFPTDSDAVFHKESESGSVFSPRVTIIELYNFFFKKLDFSVAKICKTGKNQFNYISETMHSGNLRSHKEMISSMSSFNAESCSKIGRTHRMDLAVSDGFTLPSFSLFLAEKYFTSKRIFITTCRENSVLLPCILDPQYLITLTAPDDKIAGYNDDEQGEYCTAIISLMQKHRRARIAKGEQVPSGVAFLVFRVSIKATKFLVFPEVSRVSQSVVRSEYL